MGPIPDGFRAFAKERRNLMWPLITFPILYKLDM